MSRETAGTAELLIRPMEEGDLETVCAIEREAISPPWSEAAFRDSLALEYTLFLVAERGGRVAGYCGCYLSGGEAEITNVAVGKEFRRQGIAGALLQAAFLLGQARGACTFLLEVRAGNEAAIRLYESQGFLRAGLRRGFYEHPREDALVMWKRFPDT